MGGALRSLDTKVLEPEDTVALMKSITPEKNQQELQENGGCDFGFAYGDAGRFRVAVFRQKGFVTMVLRLIPSLFLSFDQIGLPKPIAGLCRRPRGLFLVTGPTGSGKSTTLATIIDQINKERNCHILTLEDPIEYLHKHNKSIVNQREIGHDSLSFSNALRASLRQDPDVILVGEMRDLETIGIALTAAETGHLVLSTLHTLGAAKTIDRVIDVFPPYQQQQIRIQFASVIEGIISQQLLRRANNSGRVAAFEIMIATPAIRNLVREGKTYQIQTNIQTGMKFGMQSMDNSLLELYSKKTISREVILTQAIDIDFVKKYL